MPPLWQHQKRLLDKNPRKVLAVHGLGSGKTRTACEWAKKRRQALIICPKGLKENWAKEVKLWGLKDAVIISKEEFKKKVKDFGFRTLIVDEADHFFSPHFKSQLSKALRWYVKTHDPDLFMATGTPYRSSAWNIYTAATFLGYEWNFVSFRDTFFTEIRMGFRRIPIPKKGTETKLKNMIENISDVFRIEEAFDIPPQIDETILTGESKSQEMAHRNNMEILPIVRFTRDHQIEAGIGLSETLDNKLERVLQYAEDNPKLAVVCRYREQLETYKCALQKAKHTVFCIHGDIKDRQAVTDNVEKAERCVVLIQSATCEGYELPSVSVMVFASLDFSYRAMVQMKGRILRMNRLHKNIYVYLVAGNSDKAILNSLNKKQDFDVMRYYGKEKQFI